MPHPNGHKSLLWVGDDRLNSGFAHVNHPHSTTEFPPSYFILKVTTFVQVLQFNKTQLLRFLILQAHPHPDSRNLQAVPYLRILMPLVDEGIERSFSFLLISTQECLQKSHTFPWGDRNTHGMQCNIRSLHHYQNLEALPLNGTARERAVVQGCLAPWMKNEDEVQAFLVWPQFRDLLWANPWTKHT